MGWRGMGVSGLHGAPRLAPASSAAAGPDRQGREARFCPVQNRANGLSREEGGGWRRGVKMLSNDRSSVSKGALEFLPKSSLHGVPGFDAPPGGRHSQPPVGAAHRPARHGQDGPRQPGGLPPRGARHPRRAGHDHLRVPGQAARGPLGVLLLQPRRGWAKSSSSSASTRGSRRAPREAREILIHTIRERKARLLVVDGLRSVRDLWQDEAKLREFFYELSVGLATVDCTAHLPHRVSALQADRLPRVHHGGRHHLPHLR